MRFELLLVQIHLQSFALRWKTKKARYQVTERLYFTILWGIRRVTTKIVTWVGVADIISRMKFGDHYEITEGQILHCS